MGLTYKATSSFAPTAERPLHPSVQNRNLNLLLSQSLYLYLYLNQNLNPFQSRLPSLSLSLNPS